MTPEQLAALMQNQATIVLEALGLVDPELKQIITAVEMVKQQRFGKLCINIRNGEVTFIESTVQFKVRDNVDL